MADQFELISQLGRGGMGVVWKARDVATGQIVALKLLHDLYAGDAEYVARFEREVELGRRVDSPNVVKVLGFGRREGVPFLAMEYVDGPSLKEKLKQHGPYTWAEAKPLLLQVANGLAAAHAAGIVHRDVKPSNILLAPDGKAKLADFGIARANDVTSLTGTSAMLGTIAYMAPEGQRDERSDLYSLGCVAFEMLVGRPPFEGDTPHAIWAAQTTGSADLSPIGDASARKVIAWLLATKPAERPQSASALVAVLEGSSRAPVVGCRVRRRLSARLVAAVAGLVVVGLSGAFLAAERGGTLNPTQTAAASASPTAATSITPITTTTRARTAAGTAPTLAPRPPENLKYDASVLAQTLEMDMTWTEQGSVEAFVVQPIYFQNGSMHALEVSNDPSCARITGSCRYWFPKGLQGGLVDILSPTFVKRCYTVRAFAEGAFSQPSNEVCVSQDPKRAPSPPVIRSLTDDSVCQLFHQVGITIDIDQLDAHPSTIIGLYLFINGEKQSALTSTTPDIYTPGTLGTDCYDPSLAGTQVCYTAQSYNQDGLSAVSKPTCMTRLGVS